MNEKQIVQKIKMRRLRGESLTEILIASLVTALLLPMVFRVLSGELLALERFRRQDACRYGAQWWFNRLPESLNILSDRAALEAVMPAQTPRGDIAFTWETRTEDTGAVQIILTVRSGESVSLVLSRTFYF